MIYTSEIVNLKNVEVTISVPDLAEVDTRNGGYMNRDIWI